MSLMQSALVSQPSPRPPALGTHTERSPTATQSKRSGHAMSGSHGRVQKVRSPMIAQMPLAQSGLTSQMSPTPPLMVHAPQPAPEVDWQVKPDAHPDAPPGEHGVAQTPAPQ